GGGWDRMMGPAGAGATGQPAAIRIRAPGGSRHPKTSAPVAPAATSSASPQYSSHRPATAAGDGMAPAAGPPVTAFGTGAPAGGSHPMPNEEERPVTRPSTMHTV